MEFDFPKSEAEAHEHIRQIRRDKGLGDGNEHIGHNAGDLEAALGVYDILPFRSVPFFSFYEGHHLKY